MVLGSKEVRVLLILSIFAKTISDFPSIFLSRHARQRSARQRQDLKCSARRLACLALKARDKETMVSILGAGGSLARAEILIS